MGKIVLHKWKKQLLISDKILAVIFLILLGIFSSDILLIVVLFFMIPYFIISERKSLFLHLLVAMIISLLWNILARKQYSYNQDFISIFGLNIFPVLGWCLGMFLVYLIYFHYEHIFHEKEYIKKLLLFAMIYFLLLIFGETLFYHVFGVKNLATAQYSGLPICNCLHAPTWMKISYFAIGLVFFSICYYMGLENPHFKVAKSKD